VQANWLVCKDVCIPGDARFVIALRQGSAQGADSSATGNAPAGALQLEAPASAIEPEDLKRARVSLPVLAPKSLGYAVSEDGAKLVVFGGDPAQAIEGGYLFLELEGLVQPAAAQAVYQSSSQGFWLEIPLGGSSTRLLQSLKAAPTPLYAVFRPQDQKAEPVRWSLRPTRQGAFEGFQEGPQVFSGPLPSRAALLDPGKTAEQAYQAQRLGAGPEAGSGLGLGLAFLLALIGGLLLNLMPCVFPVLGLKLLALSQHAQSQAHARRHAFIFTAGVLVSMLALASVLLGLRAAGEAIGWGFQLQNPWVVMGLALLFVAMALNFFGLYELGLGLARVGARAEQNLKGSTDSGAFGSGVLAVIVASPCTAPFMGSALGFAVSAAHWSSGLLVFLGLGLGLALPFLALAVVPGGTSLLPRPGPWMQTFRQFLGFPMLATAAWLVWVLIQQQGADAGLGSLMALVLLAFALWLFGRLQTAAFQSKGATGISRWLSPLAMLLSVISIVYLVALVGQGQPVVGEANSSDRGNASASQADETDLEAARSVSGLPWRPGLAQELAAQGKVVFVDFTAAWCISCQANKARVLNRGEVAQRLGSNGYQLLTADWTRQDPVITAELTRHGRSGVPLYLVYGPALQEPLVLSEWLTEDQVVKAFQQAQAGR
jgi:thiol:disulfide interchange protein DsbD